MDLNPTVIAIPLYFILIGLELLYDKFKKGGLYRLNDSVTNISAGVSQQVTGVLMRLIPLSIYELFYSNLNFNLVSSEFNWLNFSILFIAWDFCYYWAHRMSHQVNLFWSGHVVHHQSEEYNLSVALRQSWFQGIWTAPFYIPLAMAGFSTEQVIYVGGINLIYQFWIHTEAVDRMGFLEYILNTPSHHRVHHGRNPKYIDKNHAGVFIVWDKIFGTFQREEERPTYGITEPINSWNPVWANFAHYKVMGRELSETSGFLNKLKVLFYAPGWRAENAGGPYKVPEVSRENYVKFDTPAPLKLNIYVLIQYLFTLGGTAAFLFLHMHLEMQDKIIFGSLIVWGVLSSGGLLEIRKLFYFNELVRIIASSFLLIFFFSAQAVAPGFVIPLIAFWVLISSLGALILRPIFFTSKS